MCGSEKEKYLGKYFDLIVPKKKKKKKISMVKIFLHFLCCPIKQKYQQNFFSL